MEHKIESAKPKYYS